MLSGHPVRMCGYWWRTWMRVDFLTRGKTDRSSIEYRMDKHQDGYIDQWGINGNGEPSIVWIELITTRSICILRPSLSRLSLFIFPAFLFSCFLFFFFCFPITLSSILCVYLISCRTGKSGREGGRHGYRIIRRGKEIDDTHVSLQIVWNSRFPPIERYRVDKCSVKFARRLSSFLRISLFFNSFLPCSSSFYL